MYYDDKSPDQSLQSLTNKTRFLYKIWGYFFAYALVGIFVNFLLFFFYSKVRNVSLDETIDSSVVILAVLSIMLRVLSQFNKTLIKNHKSVLLTIDLISYFFINIYCFLLLDGIRREEKIYYGHFVFIFNFVFFGVILAYLLSIYYSPFR